MCTPRDSGQAGHALVRPQRDVARMDSAGRGVEFHPSHGQWITILRTAGFVVDALHELYAAPGARTTRTTGSLALSGHRAGPPKSFGPPTWRSLERQDHSELVADEITQRISPSWISLVGDSPAARATRWEAR
jgi:hypothetical protein